MKILMITSYVTITSRSEFLRNKTGFGYMVYDIANSVGKLEQVDVLCSDSRGDGFEMDGVNYLKRSLILIVKYLLHCLSPLSLFWLRKEYSMSNSSLLRVIYYWLMTGYLNYLLKNGEYDIVHIHGSVFGTELWMQVCRKCNQKFLVTLHGLNSFSDSLKLEQAGKQYERDFLRRVINGAFPITVISTGMKSLIEKNYNANNCANILVVTNSFSFDKNQTITKESVREHYNIAKGAKVLLYVGNISQNKNQEQMVRAYSLLSEDLKRNTFVLFCGKENPTVALREAIETTGYPNHLFMCGSIDKNEMASYYKAADGVVLLSIAEGFGLSLIEGMHFGLPCAMPSDLDAFVDIYNENACVGIKDRSDKAVARSIEMLLNADWDKNTIKEYSKKFESENMAKKYIEVYNSLT